MTRDTVMIRAHNDAFRTSFTGGSIMVTSGIKALGEDAMERIFKQVRTYEDFTEDNDPYGEHDFGSFTDEQAGKLFWKIDYYDKSMKIGSPDPSDYKVTERVLTIMLASEY